MVLTIGDTDYELNTKLGTSKKLEDKFKMPLMQIFQHIEVAEIPELTGILCVGANGNKQLEADIIENWDYAELQIAVQDFLVRLMFSGSDAEKERKIEKLPAGEAEKNAMREMLGLPTGN